MNDNEVLKTNWLAIQFPNKSSEIRSCYKRCRNHCGLWILSSVILTLSLALLWALVFKEEHRQCDQQLCTTPECLKVASTILERIDPSVDPCEDFYQFSCGNFIKSNYVPDDYYAKNLLQEIQESMFVEMRQYLEEPQDDKDEHEIQQIKMLYSSCINETDDGYTAANSMESLFEMIIELTGNEWPLLSDSDVTVYKQMELEKQLALLYLYQVQPFFQIFVAANKNTSTYALHIFPGTSVMEQLNFGVIKNFDNLTDNQIEAYLNFQKDIVNAFVAFKGLNNTTERREKIEKELEQMLVFELELITKEMTLDNLNCSLNYSESSECECECDEKINNSNLFINISLADMDESFVDFKWTNFFQYVSEETNVTVNYALIHSKEYFKTIQDLLASNSKRTIINYLGWSIITKYMPYLGQQFKHLSSEFQQKIPITDIDVNENNNGFKFFQSKWKQCVHIACDGLKVPSIMLYLKHQKQNLLKKSVKIKNIIEEMKTSFLHIIDRQMWIDSDDVRNELKTRVKSIDSNIGVPDHIANRSLVNLMYANLNIDPDNRLIHNIFKINIHETTLELMKLDHLTKVGGEWLFQPLEANAFYDYPSNNIIIPVGILRKPLVNTNIPKYLELAFFGIVVGHEIAHSVDVNFRKQITEKNEFLNSTFNKSYKAKAQCFADKFSSFMIDEIGQNLNGNNTLVENICDFASFQQAYSIFKKLDETDKISLPGLSNYTAEQVFFLQYGQLWCEVATKDGHLKSLQDNHSPGRFRANGVLTNSDSFAKAFNCSTNSKMFPVKKCDLWNIDQDASI